MQFKHEHNHAGVSLFQLGEHDGIIRFMINILIESSCSFNQKVNRD